jgi:hypothetical protein
MFAGMSSIALKDWKSTRLSGLDNLETVHTTITGGAQGRQWATEQLNQSLIVRLAAEFQGFSRDLHSEVFNLMLDNQVSTDAGTLIILRANFMHARFVDSGNANPGNLGNDYARLGIALKDELKSKYPSRQPQWYSSLDRLNRARNAIAHSNAAQLAKCRDEQPLTLRSAKRWRSSLNGLAVAMDAVVGAYLKDLYGKDPW